MEKRLTFYSCHHSTPDKNFVSFKWDSIGNFDIKLEFNDSTKENVCCKCNCNDDDFDKKIKELFVDSFGYDNLYFGYTSRYILSAIRALYRQGLTDEEFEGQLEKIFEIQKNIASIDDEMTF